MSGIRIHAVFVKKVKFEVNQPDQLSRGESEVDPMPRDFFQDNVASQQERS